MKGLLLQGSPRKGGNTDILLRHVKQGMEEAGCSAELIALSDLKISPCQSCGGCTKTGKCIIQDDMQPLYRKIDEADFLVIASPIYFYALTAQTKIFIDRIQAMWSRKYILHETVECHSSKRCGYLISVAASRGAKLFDGAIMTVKYALNAMEFHYCGDLLIPGIDTKGIIRKHEDVLNRANSFGRQICGKNC